MNEKKKYDSTVARIAGNLLSASGDRFDDWAVKIAVATARAIVEETQRTEPAAASPQGAPPQ